MIKYLIIVYLEGERMDNFIDKIAQKLGSKDLIRANSSAETKEMNQMRGKLEEYETLIQQMRQVHLKNVELLRRMQKTVDVLEQLEDENVAEDKNLENRNPENIVELKEKIEAVKVSLETSSTCIEELIHTENVKVFRNVEAVVDEEFIKQEKMILKENINLKKKMRGIKPLAIITISIIGVEFLVLVGLAVNYFFELNLF
jgi:hypothetical protein